MEGGYGRGNHRGGRGGRGRDGGYGGGGRSGGGSGSGRGRDGGYGGGGRSGGGRGRDDGYGVSGGYQNRQSGQQWRASGPDIPQEETAYGRGAGPASGYGGSYQNRQFSGGRRGGSDGSEFGRDVGPASGYGGRGAYNNQSRVQQCTDDPQVRQAETGGSARSVDSGPAWGSIRPEMGQMSRGEHASRGGGRGHVLRGSGRGWGQPIRPSVEPDPQPFQGGRGWGQPVQPSVEPDQQPLQGSRGWGQPVQPHSKSVETQQVSVIPQMQALNLSEKLPSPESGGRVLPIKRPDNGGTSAIRTARLLVNHFPVKFNPDSIILHYDIDIKPVVPSKFGRPIPKPTLCMIRKKLFSDDPAQFPISKTAYDGEKNIFSAVPLPTGKFTVEFSEGEDMKTSFYIFTIKLVNELKLCKLRNYLGGNLLMLPRDILQGLDLVMKENPAMHMISAGRSFHSPLFSKEDDLGSGIIASRGSQHSLKPTSQGLAVCLDYSVLAFRKPVSVLDFLAEHVRGFNIGNFRNFRRLVENAMIGLKVRVTHRKTKQKFNVAGLTELDTRYISFLVEDPAGVNAQKQVMLVNHFKENYGRDIRYLDIPCLDLGKNNRKNYVPMEFCVLVEGQRYPKEDLDKYAALKLKDMSLAKPQDRMQRIDGMLQSEHGPCGGGVIQNFGIDVHKKMTTVVGRIIGPPELKIGGPKGKVNKVTVDREKCQWNLVGKSVVEGKPVSRWAVIDFSAFDWCRLDPNIFIPKLIGRCRNLGMAMKDPVLYDTARMDLFSNPAGLRELLETFTKRASKAAGGQLEILVCVMARRDNGYKFLKWVCETKIGMVTQCCLSIPATKANDQYLANLALKINAKLGGSNVELIERLPRFGGEGHVMFVGADVNHPAAKNTTSPSIAAVVATVNWPAANRYAARVCPQLHRMERILNFGKMCLELVEIYAQENKVKPAKIVVFRDGVSEGQFDMVLNEELVDLKKAIETPNYKPTITLIVAQKRHQTRLFPETQRDGGPTGNVSPGTVVDTKIVHPFEFDFYLCSHFGGIGTSKPTHYHVLWDEHGFASDELQKLIYNLCFTFSRCTKPVSLVPPVYYADLVAYRGRMYYEALMEGPRSHASSSSSSSSASFPVVDESFCKLHGELENIMFFV